MRRDRLSVGAPMAIIVVMSVELAALNWGTGVAVDIARMLTVFLLGVATYLARYRTGRAGAWCFGFALFGWAYYILVIDVMGQRFAFASDSVITFLPTVIMDLWTSALPPIQRYQNYDERIRIIHELMVPVVATIGGTFCWLIGRRRRPSADDGP
jgi:hypothetical protein